MASSDRNRAIAEPRSVDPRLDAVDVTHRRGDLGLETPFVAPTGVEEIRIADAWRASLGIDAVGVDDNFFELGGDSLGITHALIEIRRAWQVDVPIEAFFDRPTIRQLAAIVVAARPADDEATG